MPKSVNNSGFRTAPRVITEFSGPVCRAFAADGRVMAVDLYCLARTMGQAPGDDVMTIIDGLLAEVQRGVDPRTVFHWRAGKSTTGDPSTAGLVRAGHPDSRRKSNTELWREQLIAAEVLRLARSEGCGEPAAKEYVATAFQVDTRAVERALTEWRAELEAGDLERYLACLSNFPPNT